MSAWSQFDSQRVLTELKSANACFHAGTAKLIDLLESTTKITKIVDLGNPANTPYNRINDLFYKGYCNTNELDENTKEQVTDPYNESPIDWDSESFIEIKQRLSAKGSSLNSQTEL